MELKRSKIPEEIILKHRDTETQRAQRAQRAQNLENLSLSLCVLCVSVFSKHRALQVILWVKRKLVHRIGLLRNRTRWLFELSGL
jgi:hypothetical protein